MGVKNLWQLLSEESRGYKKDLDVSTLKGATIAIDLSSWILEMSKATVSKNISKSFLLIRNLYFRTTNFLKSGVKLIFVEDGRAPELKQKTLLHRNSGKDAGLDRNWLKGTSQQCRELLTLLGIPCIQSDGEGEALCAQLNSAGIVDGVLTSDGDTLLYGAKKVYRNYDRKKQTVESLDMEAIENTMGVTRRGLVTMAILGGCDYTDGVKDVGIKNAYKFVKHCKVLNVDPLDRMMAWRKDEELSELQKKRESPQSKKPHCSQCKHLGTKPDHVRNGCNPCGTDQQCDQSSGKNCTCDSCCLDNNIFELKLREKSLKYPNFPDQRVIEEFLNFGLGKALPALQWMPINVSGLKLCIQRYLKWDDKKFFDEISELLITLQVCEMDWSVSNRLVPIRIVKKCTRNKIPCVTVDWTKLDADTVTDKHCTVTVPEENFIKMYPQLMEEFSKKAEEEKQQKTHKKSRKRKDKSNTEGPSGQSTMANFFPTVKKAKMSTKQNDAP